MRLWQLPRILLAYSYYQTPKTPVASALAVAQ
jgi:hypothetical protein